MWDERGADSSIFVTAAFWEAFSHIMKEILPSQVISSCTEVWQDACRELGWRTVVDQQVDQLVDQVVQQQDAAHWKEVYIRARLRTAQLGDQEAFQTSSLIGHSARVYALYYRDGLLCTGRCTRRYTFLY